MRILRAVLVAVFLAGSVLIGTSMAQASTVPVIYDTEANGWVAHVRPATIYFGQGGSPILGQLTWKTWGSGSAWGTGKLWTQTPGCTPSYKCAYHSRWAGVYLNTVRLHNGHRYFARMAVEFFVAGKARWDVGWIGSSGFWRFPAVWPYL